jgi:hypothetical protein
MRWDMFKVIVERPRRGGGWARKRRRTAKVRLDPEAAPKSEAMGRGRGTKGLNENLAPLRRYLCGQVGRPWDIVHAEICAHIRLGSAVQQHVLQHLAQMVVKDVVMDGKQPRSRATGWLIHGSHWRDLVFVDPVTGLLRRTPPRPRAAALPSRDRVALTDGDQLQRIRGVWYHVILRKIPDPPAERRAAVDAVVGARLDRWWLLPLVAAQHGAGVYATSKRQIGKRELARLLPEDLR